MKVSIITVTFNSNKTIKDCIRSVNSQTYKNIEHIIIDGNSDDGTTDIIKSIPKRHYKFISEPDNGIYDAMNKGISKASGDIIAFLNSDDLYINNGVISKVVECFRNFDPDVVYADLYYVRKDNTDTIVRKWSSGNYKKGSFYRGWHPPHPTFIAKRKVYTDYGGFNLNLKLAADFEIMLRLLEKYQLKHYYLPVPIVKMRMGGATNKSIQNILKQNVECYRAFQINEMKVSLFYPMYRVLPKISQFFK